MRLEFLAAAIAGLTATAPEPAPPLATADDFTSLFAAKHDLAWSGGDQMTSFLAPNGRVYWISADTILSNGVDADGSYPDKQTHLVANRVLLQVDGRLDKATEGDGASVPNPATHTLENQERYWPQGAFFANDFLFLLCQRVVRDDRNHGLGFRFTGTELAKFRVLANGRLAFQGMAKTPASNVAGGFGVRHVQWAADAVAHGGFIYIYGYTQALPGNPRRVAHYSYIARVRPAQVEDPSAWQIYQKSKSRWMGSAAQLSPHSDNRDAILASQISSVRWVGGKLLIAHKPWNGLGTTISIESSARPEGPFKNVATIPSPAGQWRGSNYQTYSPMLHPEQRLSGKDLGKLLLSVSWNGQDFAKDVIPNADLYKPRFFAVQAP